ncbi:Crp/Fnr family transcriptional regulator [Brevirhabdus pacifica]|uniref:Crp/Fnr family transcriptional regulator n=1 Tax=Brevirhabdus pacifica TaxID=1267768 RepID=A0A1U7DI77_9RHOB|nr:Crp/Fnr family transcriptional regulator [Brevirhabdus pacifica]OWU74534.1 Crp/Fnr family transcriptional regulator [Loktanella sp. 22II-4b]
MVTKCVNCPLARKPLFKPMSRDELAYMQRFKVGELVVDPRTSLLMEGSNSPQLYTTLRGMGLRYKTLPSGRRHVIGFVFPGDFIGLQAGVMGEMEHSVEASTSMTLCVFDRAEFWNFLKLRTDRAFDVIWLSAVEEHFLGEALATVGQRTAVEKVAWALVRFYRRGKMLHMVEHGSMPLPYKQQDLADALGLSLVHTNKTLAKLRDRQLANWSDGILSVHDVDRLAALAQDDGSEVVTRPLL